MRRAGGTVSVKIVKDLCEQPGAAEPKPEDFHCHVSEHYLSPY